MDEEIYQRQMLDEKDGCYPTENIKEDDFRYVNYFDTGWPQEPITVFQTNEMEDENDSE